MAAEAAALDQAALDQAVLDVVRSRLPGLRDPARVTLDTDLWGVGMDSLGNIAVMVGLEDRFDIEFPDELLTREVFSRPRTMADAIRVITTGGREPSS